MHPKPRGADDVVTSVLSLCPAGWAETARRKHVAAGAVFCVALGLALVGAAFGPCRAAAQTAADAARTQKVETLPLSLRECIRMALESNLDIQIQKVEPDIAEQDILAARAAFEPYFTGGAAVTDNVTATASATDGNGQERIARSKEDVYGLQAALVKLLRTGATLSIEYELNRINNPTSATLSINPRWTDQIALKLSQPLLRGAGVKYNVAPIRIATNNRIMSLLALRERAIEVVSAVEDAYWQLVQATEDLKVNQTSLQVAEDLRQKKELEVKVGKKAELELLTAEAGVASRTEGVIVASNAVRSAEDRLKNAINLPKDWFFKDLFIEPQDKPVAREQTPELRDAIDQALAHRTELKRLSLHTDSLRIKRDMTRNELLPYLAAEASYGYNGLGGNFGNAADELGSGRYVDQSIGLQVEIPLGNAAARAAHRSARLQVRRVRIQTEKALHDIIVQVRTAVRQVLTNFERLRATGKARQLHRRRLQAEETKLREGLSTSLTVLEVEEDVAKAERDYIRALIDCQISLKDLEVVKGTLLEAKGVQVYANPPRAAASVRP